MKARQQGMSDSAANSVADSNITMGELIDSGLFGVVWKATQLIPPRTVAVKIVNPEFGLTFDAAEHARGLVKAGPHPNIVTVYQVTKVAHPQNDEVVEAVVMEWLDGPSLGKLLGEALLSRERAEEVCSGILNGMHHLHSNNVTHSDLHVGNIIVTAQGPRIIDIDYSSAKSLALLTTLDRDQRIQADISEYRFLGAATHGNRSRVLCCK
jgi:serine/threonine protein kinase